MRKQNNLYKTPIWNNVFEHLNYIFPAVLYDKFGFTIIVSKSSADILAPYNLYSNLFHFSDEFEQV